MDYPKPLVVEPLQLPHKQTFILLHGRGSSGENFGPVLLETLIASNTPSSSSSANNSPSATLRGSFPHVRFVFPTAALRRATIYKRSLTHQWFNNWKLDPPATDREDLQVPGLQETAAYLHSLLRNEIDLVPGGAGNVVFGGLSQGCAASLTAMLLWEGERLGAIVGMCGWLPFAERLMEEVGSENVGNDENGAVDAFDPFARDDDSGQGESPPSRAIGWLKQELGLPSTISLPFKFQDIPFFLGHRVQDDRVSIVLGRRASECLSSMGGRVCWKEYKPLGHWYSAEMLRDIVQFLCKDTGWNVE